MKNYEILRLQNYNDNGGQYELIKAKSTIVQNGLSWTYISTGLVRDVFISPNGQMVLKVPKRFDTWGFEHNRLEVECYNEAPDWCKKHIAESYLTEEGYVVQEYLNVHYIGDNYWRELGYRADGTCVIFDCDIFLDHDLTKPKSGFKYEKVFEVSRGIFDLEIPKQIEYMKRKKRFQQKENRNLHFPKLDNGELTVCTTNGSEGQHVYVYPRQLSSAIGCTTEFEIRLELALECGFINE